MAVYAKKRSVHSLFAFNYSLTLRFTKMIMAVVERDAIRSFLLGVRSPSPLQTPLQAYLHKRLTDLART